MPKDQSTLAITIHRLFYEKEGQMVVSALFGLALALIFRRVCKDNCTLYFAPNIEDIQDKTFRLEDQCYRYKAYTTKCDNTQKVYQQYDVNMTPENKVEDSGLLSKLFS